MECELLATCGFFKKHMDTRELACRGFITQYCKGDKMNECKRKEIRKLTGVPPDPDILPTGQRIFNK